ASSKGIERSFRVTLEGNPQEIKNQAASSKGIERSFRVTLARNPQEIKNQGVTNWWQLAYAVTNKTNSKGDTEILNIGEEQGEDVADKARLDPGQSNVAFTGPDPEPMHDDFVATVYPQVHESLKHPDEEHVHMENPLSSTRTLSSMKNLDAYTFATTETTTTTLPPPLPQQQSTTNPALASRISALEMVCANFEKRDKVQDKIVQGLSSRIFTLKLRDLPYKIDQTVNEAVKEVVQVALQDPLKECFRDLSEADMT
nr:hypothetical protein [Tanacetum cinerariifolium]